jgi:hypothetical protein
MLDQPDMSGYASNRVYDGQRSLTQDQARAHLDRLKRQAPAAIATLRENIGRIEPPSPGLFRTRNFAAPRRG